MIRHKLILIFLMSLMTFLSVSSTTEAQTEFLPLYRWWSYDSTDHFYTTDPTGEVAPISGYDYEGIACYLFSAQVPGTTPLYRWWNLHTSDHFYTTDPNAPVSGYTYEGITGYVATTQISGTTPFYQWWYTDRVSNDDHFYTTDPNGELAPTSGYTYEGIVGYVWTTPLPARFDWRDHASLPEIREQGNCGSCWAFAAVGAVECAYAVKHNISIDLSEQQLVSDCECPGSCYGGHVKEALNFMVYSGIVADPNFTYQSSLCSNTYEQDQLCWPSCLCGDNCSNPCSCPESLKWADKFHILAFNPVAKEPTLIKQALISKGPLAVSSMNWKHSFVLVGYDDLNVKWIIRNSWGTQFQDDGYAYIPYSDARSDFINNAYSIDFY